jgi:4'-phosphopantetheinyl transferase
MESGVESVAAPDIKWPVPPPDWPLALHPVQSPAPSALQVHVWAATLDLTPAALAASSTTLCAAEIERANRFRLMRDRNRFVAGRGLLRVLLSRYLQIEPRQIEFVYGAQGKPSLGKAFLGSGLEFNLAHSHNLALLAVTNAGPVGVDVERIDPMADTRQLVARFFSARESAAFDRLPTDLKPAAFFNLWTRKEAWLKATGEGVGHLLDQVEVSFAPGAPARLLSLPGNARTAESWDLYDLSPAPGFAAALAIAVRNLRLCCWRWKGEPTRV